MTSDAGEDGRPGELRAHGRDPGTSARQMLAGGLGREIFQTVMSRGAGIALGLVTGVFVARTLGPEGRGAYFLAMTAATLLAQFGHLGLPAANTYKVAREPDLLPSLTANSVWVATTGGVTLGTGLYAFVTFSEALPLTSTLAGVAAVWIPFALAAMLLQNLMIGVGAVGTANIIDVGQKAATVGLLAALLLLGTVTPVSVLAAQVVTIAVAALASVATLRKRSAAPGRSSWALFRSMVAYGARSFGASVVSFLLLKADIIMVGSILGLEATGIYSIAAAMGEYFLLLPITAGTLLFPRLAAMADPLERWAIAKRFVLYASGLMGALAVIAIPLAEPLINLLYGQEFVPASRPFLILLPGAVLLSANVILNNYFAAVGMPLVTLFAPLVGLLTNVALNVILAPRWGIDGAAVATAVSYAVMLAGGFVYAGSEGHRKQLQGKQHANG